MLSVDDLVRDVLASRGVPDDGSVLRSRDQFEVYMRAAVEADRARR